MSLFVDNTGMYDRLLSLEIHNIYSVVSCECNLYCIPSKWSLKWSIYSTSSHLQHRVSRVGTMNFNFAYDSCLKIFILWRAQSYINHGEHYCNDEMVLNTISLDIDRSVTISYAKFVANIATFTNAIKKYIGSILLFCHYRRSILDKFTI